MDGASLRDTVQRLEAALQDQLTLQRRLEALDELLPTLSGVLDIREVFDRLSAISRRVIPHDMVSLPLLTADKNSIVVYAVSGSSATFPHIVPLPDHHRWLVTSPWDHLIQADIQEDPLERLTPPAQAGYRGRLLMPIRLQGELAGALDFLSKEAGIYSAGDVLVARRIADHVSLALSHERLAAESRRAAALREQTMKLELLDLLLTAVTDGGEQRVVIDRISDVAQKVLPHDAMVVPLLLADGAHVHFHVTKTPAQAKLPDVMEVPEHLRRSDWDHEIVDDLQADSVQKDSPPAQLGYRSALRIPIRIDGALVGGVEFFSLTPSQYTQADVPVARRVADRLALSLVREHGIAAARRADEAAERAARLEARVQALTDELNARTDVHRVIGKSHAWRTVLTQATQVAATDTTVLLLGESGTGKEVVARFIHRASKRTRGPFVALNCAALPEPLLESELFGFERGAFTGATQSKPGRIELAAGGVLFLDEVAEMSPSAQAKFLRVLQEREFQRLGSTRVLKADVRVIAATNRDLRAAMQAGTFREDLYYRLHVFEIRLPPLRDRREDILPLSDTFLQDIAKAFGRPPAGISREARDALVGYAWPGNVRELHNMLERAAILCDGGLIAREHLTFIAREEAKPSAPAAAKIDAAVVDSVDLRIVERATIERALLDARHNKSAAAKMLGLSRKQLYVRLRQHGLH